MRSANGWVSALLVPVTGALVWIAVGIPDRAFTGLVLHGARVEEVVARSPAERAGIHVGDRLVPSDPTSARARSSGGLLAGMLPDQPVVLPLERAGRRFAVVLVPDHLPRQDLRLFALLLMVASGFVMLASLVWSERRDALTRAFFLLSLAFAILVAPLPQWRSPQFALIYEAAYAGITLFLPALFIHFFFLFPESARPGGPIGAGVTASYGLASVLFVLTLASLALPRPLLVTAEPIVLTIETVAAVWFAAGLLAATWLFVRSFRAADTGDSRRRLRVALAGTLLGVAPLTAVILLRSFSPGTAVPGEKAAVVLTLLVPASFAWAIVVHRVFDVRVALRAAAVVGMLALGGVVTLATSDQIASSRGRPLADRIAASALAAMAIGAALAGAVAAGIRPRRAQLQAAYEGVVSGASRSAPAPSLSREVLLASACRTLNSELRLAGCAAVAAEPGGMRLLASAGSLSPGPLGPRLATDLFDQRGIAGLDQLALEPSDRDALDLAGVRWLIPLGEPGAGTVLLLGRRLAGSWLGRHELRELERFGAHLEVSLENLDLRREATSHLALDRELREAGAIQAHLLPRRVPAYPTLDCAAAALSSEPVGGDYYDFIETGGRDFTLAVGDAAGKGVPAALLLAGVQARFRSEARRGLGPSALLSALNRQLVQLDQPEKFVGLLCARVDVREARIGFANAGLTPPLIHRSSGAFEELTAGGVLLGVRPDSDYEDSWLEMSRGDVAVLYTDGLTEARRGETLFGVERVQEVLSANAGRRASEILAALLRAVRAFASQPLDDLTVVVLRQLTHPPGARSRAA